MCCSRFSPAFTHPRHNTVVTLRIIRETSTVPLIADISRLLARIPVSHFATPSSLQPRNISHLSKSVKAASHFMKHLISLS